MSTNQLPNQPAILLIGEFAMSLGMINTQLRLLGAGPVYHSHKLAESLHVLATEPVKVTVAEWSPEFVRDLQVEPALRARPIMMLVKPDVEMDRIKQVIALGVSEILALPYTSRELYKRIDRCMNPLVPPPLPAAAPAPAAEPEPLRLTVLVVDDTPDNLTQINELLKAEYKIKVANNGEKALDICQSDNPPDLVLLDVMMPGMDGFEVAKRLREHPNCEHIPIIFVTALTGDEERMRGLELGAFDYVTKPIDGHMLQVRVRNFMRYIRLHKQLQNSYDAMLEVARLRAQIKA